MRIVNLDGRLSLEVDGGAVDVEKASDGMFSSEPQAIFDRWSEFTDWAQGKSFTADGPIDKSLVGPPVPRPTQVFAIGVNYRDHAAEAGIVLPENPMVFTKFPASVTGPFAEITLPSNAVDFEVEMVVVIGKRARHVAVGDGWDHVAGITVGQDLSEREVQLGGTAPQQYNMGKSFEGFAPIGPSLVTPEEFEDRDDLAVACELGGEQMQSSRTSEFVFSVPELISYLSGVLPLLPGDLIFTGTPAGIGWMRQPRRTIQAGETLVTTLEGVGSMHNTFVNQSH